MMMPSRRGPRWVFWPAKLLWVPSLVLGAWMTFVSRPSVDALGGGAFRVGLRFFDSASWSAHPVTHGTGVVLLLAGLVLLAMYLWTPGPDGVGVVEEFPLWTLAAWAFAAVALGAALRWNGHVWDVALDGISWRFLLSLRAHPLDRVVAIVALVLAVVCSAVSYGRALESKYMVDDGRSSAMDS